MENNSYSSISNIILFATLSTSVVSLSYSSDTIIPQTNHNFVYQESIDSWSDNLLQNTQYQAANSDSEKLQTMVDFSRKMIDNTKDIDSEFVDIVNDNFWDLV